MNQDGKQIWHVNVSFIVLVVVVLDNGALLGVYSSTVYSRFSDENLPPRHGARACVFRQRQRQTKWGNLPRGAKGKRRQHGETESLFGERNIILMIPFEPMLIDLK